QVGSSVCHAITLCSGDIAQPALVSCLCICIVFIPMFCLSGVARFLFVPFAEAVVFAVLASYVLSRTLVPTLVMWFERNHEKLQKARRASFLLRPFIALQQGFERGFDRFRTAYRNLLGTVLNHRGIFAVAFLSFATGSW